MNGIEYQGEESNSLVDFLHSVIGIAHNESIECSIKDPSSVATDRIQDVVDDEEVQKLYDAFIINDEPSMGAENGEESDNGTNEKQELAIKKFKTAFNEFKLPFSNNSHCKTA